MTELEVYLHGTIGDIKDALMSKGLSSDVDFIIANLCDTAHRIYLSHIRDDIKATMEAPKGPGGIHHQE